MKKIRVMTIFGSRPEAIKMAPLVVELERQSERFTSFSEASLIQEGE